MLNVLVIREMIKIKAQYEDGGEGKNALSKISHRSYLQTTLSKDSKHAYTNNCYGAASLETPTQKL